MATFYFQLNGKRHRATRRADGTYAGIYRITKTGQRRGHSGKATDARAAAEAEYQRSITAAEWL